MTQEELFKALLDGKTLISPHKIKIKMIDGYTVDIDVGTKYRMDCYVNWQIYNEFEDLKKAYDEGAIIEFWNIDKWQEAIPNWDTGSKYRIKGGISLNSWNAHKEIIKAWWWNDVIIEYRESAIEEWKLSGGNCPLWFMNTEYRIKPEPAMYCKMKKEHEDGVYTTAYLKVGGKMYTTYKELKYVELERKTYEEIT
jgi:hypothetical protein